MGHIFVAFVLSVILLFGLGPSAHESVGKKVAFVVALLVAASCIIMFSIDAFTIRAW